MNRRFSVAAVVFAGALLAGPALAETAPPSMISVTGEAAVSVAPDQAQIEGGVTSDAKTAREASEANNAAMGKVLRTGGVGSGQAGDLPWPTRSGTTARSPRSTTAAARRRHCRPESPLLWSNTTGTPAPESSTWKE